MFRKATSTLAVVVLIGGFFYVSAIRAGLNFDFMQLWPYRARFFHGFLLTLQIAFYSMILSLILGTLIVAMRSSKSLFLKKLARTYLEVIRGTPLLVQIIFFYYVVGTAWGVSSRLMAGVIILSIFESAYISEIIRGGLNSIGSKQKEIAKSIGLTNFQTYRLVILPQLFMRILPALAGQFASVIKDSSLLSMIALIELTQITKEITANNFNTYFVGFIFLALLYLSLTFPVSLLSHYLERKTSYEN